MAQVSTESPPIETLADLLKRLGDIPPSRVLLRPYPGTATEKDVIAAAEAPRKRLCELVDGVLVEKTVGYEESNLTQLLSYFLVGFVRQHDLGSILGPDGALRLVPGLVRIPDISFICWDRLPGRKHPKNAIPDLAPDLAVEVLSKGNTRKEMDRKLRDYFAAGARLVWYVDPKSRTVRVFTGVAQSVVLHEADVLDGGDVLPGFRLPLGELFLPAR